MVKGLRLTTSRSERLLGTYRHGPAAGDSPELSEDEVWSVINGQDHEPHITYYKSHSDTCTSIGRGLSTLASEQDQYHDHNYKTKTRNIVHKLVSQRGQRHVAASAPVNVPDWSKIYRVDSVEVLGELNVYDDDEEEDEVVPPHEYLAREYRRIATNSVFEGVGRTLKGRDMSRVRDSVWGQTGFNG